MNLLHRARHGGEFADLDGHVKQARQHGEDIVHDLRRTPDEPAFESSDVLRPDLVPSPVTEHGNHMHPEPGLVVAERARLPVLRPQVIEEPRGELAQPRSFPSFLPRTVAENVALGLFAPSLGDRPRWCPLPDSLLSTASRPSGGRWRWKFET